MVPLLSATRPLEVAAATPSVNPEPTSKVPPDQVRPLLLAPPSSSSVPPESSVVLTAEPPELTSSN